MFRNMYTRRTAPAEATEAQAAIDSAHTHMMAVDAAEGNTKRRIGIQTTIAAARRQLREGLYNTAKHTALQAIEL